MTPILDSATPAGDWIDRNLPASWRPYARLMRLEHPIGSWLLLIPCWWGVALASPGLPDPWLLALFAIGAVVMRGAGCIVNDIYDRDLDRMVERTKNRPLAAGSLNVVQALLFLVFVLMWGAAVLCQFNYYTRGLGLASLALVFSYPLAKRVTWWPQLVLGFTFNWGALVGWSAVWSGLSVPALCLYLAGIFWTLGYDTVYAHQDKRDDMMVGIKSLALKLGADSVYWIPIFYAISLGLFTMAGYGVGEGALFYIMTLCGAAYMGFQLRGWRMDDPVSCHKAFCANRIYGLFLFLALVMGKFL